MQRFLWWVTQWLRVRVIYVDGRPYLERYYLGRVFDWTAYLHRFVREDSERWLHDHPWRLAVSVVLAGGYLEERWRWLCPQVGLVTEVCCVTWGNILRGRDFHRIIHVLPGTWTLFLHGRRAKEWGFVEEVRPRIGQGCMFDYQQPFPVERTADWASDAPLARDYRRAQELDRLAAMVRGFDEKLIDEIEAAAPWLTTEDITTPRGGEYVIEPASVTTHPRALP